VDFAAGRLVGHDVGQELDERATGLARDGLAGDFAGFGIERHEERERAVTPSSRRARRLSEDIMEHLLLCRWPGNVRQLQNEVRRIAALGEPNAVLTPADLSEEVFNTRLAPRPMVHHDHEMIVPLNEKLLPTVSKIERAMIRLALRDHHSNLDDAARALGISRKGLYLKRQRLGL
jgi:transcriptional regulator of acetoin/glycerol metabolism